MKIKEDVMTENCFSYFVSEMYLMFEETVTIQLTCIIILLTLCILAQLIKLMLDLEITDGNYFWIWSRKIRKKQTV